MNSPQILRGILWPYGKNGPAQMATGYVSVGRRNRRKERGRPNTRWADTLKKVAEGQKSQAAKIRCE
jgi:hypothetical protein